jgi:hypothetical protein
MLRIASAAALAAALVTLASPALAQTDPGVRMHDGFHFSIGVGAGYAIMSASLDPEPPTGTDISISGAGVAGQLLFGGTPAPGLVIGGGSQGGHFFSPKVEVDGTEVDSDGDLSANLLGPYLQYYFTPNQGFYAQVMLGIASMDDGNDDTDGLATGFGASAGLGNEWWIADQWGIGVLARCQFLATSQELEAPGATADISYTAIVPALLVNFTYH